MNEERNDELQKYYKYLEESGILSERAVLERSGELVTDDDGEQYILTLTGKVPLHKLHEYFTPPLDNDDGSVL